MSAPTESRVFSTYSSQADRYDDRAHEGTCWGAHTQWIIDSIHPPAWARTIADLGCGTGAQLRSLADRTDKSIKLFGVEPADNMRAHAISRNADLRNVEVRAGSFEAMPLEDRSIDYMYSINAFHWASDPTQGLIEMDRVMRRPGRMEHCFIGRDIGREFIRATSPIFMKYMGPKKLLAAATMRFQFTRGEAEAFFAGRFGRKRVEASEVYKVYHDSVENHLIWWVRIEPQLLDIPEDKKEACFTEVKRALAKLDTGKGVPYTMHQLRVKVTLD